MKKLLFVVAVAACLLSCRSVKHEGYIQQHHHSVDADTLSLVVNAERRDSSKYFHGVIDSLSMEILRVRQAYQRLYERDSINEVTKRWDSESVKDTTWMSVNPDGSVTYHHYREKNTYSHQQFERYRQQIVKESQATIDSLIERNTHLQAQCDSISMFKSYADSLSIYKAKLDSISDTVSEKEKITVEKFSLWSRVKLVFGTVVCCVIVFVIVLIYLRFFKR